MEWTAHAPDPGRERPGECKKLLNSGHGFPFGRLSPQKGKGAFRQSLIVAESELSA
jgi:hypothetical protein